MTICCFPSKSTADATEAWRAILGEVADETNNNALFLKNIADDFLPVARNPEIVIR